jgi:hypothetical protein
MAKLKLLIAISIVGTLLAFTDGVRAAQLGGTLSPIDPLTGLPITTAIDGSTGASGTNANGYSPIKNTIDGSIGASGTDPSGYSPIKGTIDGSIGASPTISPVVFPVGNTLIGSGGSTYTIAPDGSVQATTPAFTLPTAPSFAVNSSNPNAFTSASFTITPSAGYTPIVFANPLAPCVADPKACAANPQATFSSLGNISATVTAAAQKTAEDYMNTAEQAGTKWLVDTATAKFQAMFPGLAGLFGGSAPTAPPKSSTTAERQIVSPASATSVVAVAEANDAAARNRAAAQIAVDVANKPNVTLSGGSNPTTENGTIIAGTFLSKGGIAASGAIMSDSNKAVKAADNAASSNPDDSLTAINNLTGVTTGLVHQMDANLDQTNKLGIVQAQLLKQTSESQDLQRKIALSEADASVAFTKRNLYADAYINGISKVKAVP